MERLADDVFLLKTPRYAINTYLVGDVLLDSGTNFDGKRILGELRGSSVTAHALTHGHPDHCGSSHRVCETLGIPLWCPTGDAGAVETGTQVIARSAIAPLLERLPTPAPHPVARRLVEGDEVAGFRVLDAPGHSPGQMAYWRESDRTLILGDVLTGMHLLTTKPGLHEPPGVLTPDPARNRESARKLAELQPALLCFGHGPPLRDTRRFTDFVAALPA
jgi:hydroxyacylglutathione hydrolase